MSAAVLDIILVAEHSEISIEPLPCCGGFKYFHIEVKPQPPLEDQGCISQALEQQAQHEITIRFNEQLK